MLAAMPKVATAFPRDRATALTHDRPAKNTAVQPRVLSENAMAKFLAPTYLKTDTALLPALILSGED